MDNPSPSKDASVPEISKKRNAFSALMAPKPKQLKPSSGDDPNHSQHSSKSHPNDIRSGLLAYILQPTTFSSGQVITHNDHIVLIRDAFPKATVHLLLLPRDPDKRDLHPHEAFEDLDFLMMIRTQVSDAVKLAASELSRLIGSFSIANQARIEAMESEEPPDVLPAGRDYLKDIRVGVHAHPSMHHLHIHIISRDMHSDRLKHRKHYNSFNTEFFIPLDDYPLSPDDRKRDVRFQNNNLKEDFKCWRCGKTFGNKFQKLKEHLDEEFDAWKRE
ncbi:hypothetical protein PV10_04479 [Exophiala mesophila]|uniref:Aprataxin-like protein n=1 Tax=Exophiala mesophila TaxID=212818 RepID=A0A0D2A2F3_EXOME|nr:uncharacterized protein PV10_04479 [Exophiala mesophila]KIV93253.1 hypothetical protein PV10_04479 [Exophiala mesophila]